MGFFHAEKKTWRSLQPNNLLCSFKCPRKPWRHLLHPASKFSTSLNAGPIAVCSLAPSLSQRHNINCPDCKIKQLSRCYLYDSDAACDYQKKKKSNDYFTEDPAKKKKKWLVVRERESEGWRLRIILPLVSALPGRDGWQIIAVPLHASLECRVFFVCTVSRCTASDWIPRDALEWQFVIDMLD